MTDSAKKTDPELWDAIKDAITAGDRGGKPGQWSARKAQLATSQYKKEGGGYEGARTADNHLVEWEREDWGTASGNKSGETGERYLPRAARESLSEEEYARTSRRKRADAAKGRQHSPQPADVAHKTARHRDGGQRAALEGRTKAELLELAREREVPGRSWMRKAQLLDALS